ncbi:MAG: ABC transporter ATP-binding protein [Lachnospiraceae bacterium]
MLRVNHFSFSYGKGRQPVLEDLNFHIGEGRLIALLGPNGAGKSTLFKCVLGFLKNYEGEIFLGGKNIKGLSRKELARLAAYIPQSEQPAFNYTVMDSVLMGTTGSLSPLSSPGEEQIQTAREAIDYLGIGYMAQRGINEISGGERQLTMLARAMAQKARLLIMDEPTANLDYGNQQMVMDNVKQMAGQGYTILLSTHNPEHALQYATHVLAIKDHHILADGTVEEVLTEELIRAIYGLKVKVVELEINGKKVRSCIPLRTVGIREEGEVL